MSDLSMAKAALGLSVAGVVAVAVLAAFTCWRLVTWIRARRAVPATAGAPPLAALTEPTRLATPPTAGPTLGRHAVDTDTVRITAIRGPLHPVPPPTAAARPEPRSSRSGGHRARPGRPATLTAGARLTPQR